MYMLPLIKHETPDEIRIETNLGGIGDIICCAFAVAGVRKKHPEKRIVFDVTNDYVNRRPWGEFFTDADEVVTHARQAPPKIDENQKREINDNPTRTRIEIFSAWADAEPAWPRTKPIPPFDFSHLGFDAPPLVLVPQSTQALRTWPHFIPLARMLVANQIPFVWLGHGIQASNAIETRTPIEMASVLTSSALVITGDTGPAHLAGVLSVPCLVLNSVHASAAVFGNYHSVETIQAKAPCSPCSLDADKGFKADCMRGCPALAEVSVETVFNRIISILNRLTPEHLHPNALRTAPTPSRV